MPCRLFIARALTQTFRLHCWVRKPLSCTTACVHGKHPLPAFSTLCLLSGKQIQTNHLLSFFARLVLQIRTTALWPPAKMAAHVRMASIYTRACVQWGGLAKTVRPVSPWLTTNLEMSHCESLSQLGTSPGDQLWSEQSTGCSRQFQHLSEADHLALLTLYILA